MSADKGTVVKQIVADAIAGTWEEWDALDPDEAADAALAALADWLESDEAGAVRLREDEPRRLLAAMPHWAQEWDDGYLDGWPSALKALAGELRGQAK